METPKAKPPTVRISLPPKPSLDSGRFVISGVAGRILDERSVIDQINDAIQKGLNLSAHTVQFRYNGMDNVEVLAIMDSGADLWVSIGLLPRRLVIATFSRLKIMASMSIAEGRRVQNGEIEFKGEPLSERPGVKFRAVFVPGDAHFPSQFILSRV